MDKKTVLFIQYYTTACVCVCVCRISNLLLQYIIILPITLHLATFGGSLILEAQFPKHVITVVDTKLLLLNQS